MQAVSLPKQKSTNVRSVTRALGNQPASPAASTIYLRNGSGQVPLAVQLIRLGFRTIGRVAPRLMARFAYRIWFRTARFPHQEWERQLLERAEQLPFDWKGKRIAVFSWGEGPVVLLIHGWSARASRMGAFVDPLVEAGYRVVAFDAPGHGQSSGNRTDVFEIRDVIRRVAERFGPLDGVIAHSLGVLGFAAATRESFAPERAVCLSPGVNLDTFVRIFANTLHLPDRVTSELTDLLHAFVGPDFTRGLWDGLRDLPTLVVHDRDDADIPWGDGKAMADALPQARFIATRGLGHRGVLRDDQVVQSAVEFITGADDLTDNGTIRETVWPLSW